MNHLSFLAAVAIAMTVAYACVGAFVALRRPRNAVGWILLAIGGVTGLTLTLDVAAQLHAPGWNALAWIQQWSFYLVYPAAFSMLVLLFPTGRPATKKWTWLAIAIPAGQLPRLGIAALGGGPIAGHMSGAPLSAASPIALIPASFLDSNRGGRKKPRHRREGLPQVVYCALGLFHPGSWSSTVCHS